MKMSFEFFNWYSHVVIFLRCFYYILEFLLQLAKFNWIMLSRNILEIFILFEQWKIIFDSFESLVISQFPVDIYLLQVNKVNNKLASFWCCPYCKLWVDFIPCSCVSIVNFEHVIPGWFTLLFLVEVSY